MGRQHPPKIKNEEHKKQDYPSIGRMSPKKTINESSMKTIEKTTHENPHEMSHENPHENYHDNPRKNKPKHSN